MIAVPVGEHPSLPAELIRTLHESTQAARHQVADYLWTRAAGTAVTVFESYHCTRS